MKTRRNQNYSNLFFLLGYEKPDAIFIKHFAYLDIKKDDIYYDQKTNQYFLKLPKNSHFDISISNGSDFKSEPRIDYDLLFKGRTIASSSSFVDRINFNMDPDSISFVMDNLDNQLTIPNYDFDGNAGGTIEACVKNIKKNQSKSFFLEAPSDELCQKFGYEVFNHEKAQLLIHALTNNFSLQKMYLRRISISKNDFFDLIKTLNNIPTFTHLDLCNSVIDVSIVEVPDIINTLANVKKLKVINCHDLEDKIEKCKHLERSKSFPNVSKDIAKSHATLFNSINSPTNGALVVCDGPKQDVNELLLQKNTQPQ